MLCSLQTLLHSVKVWLYQKITNTINVFMTLIAGFKNIIIENLQKLLSLLWPSSVGLTLLDDSYKSVDSNTESTIDESTQY